nr:hypothetical protein [Sphingomonas sp. BE137]
MCLELGDRPAINGFIVRRQPHDRRLRCFGQSNLQTCLDRLKFLQTDGQCARRIVVFLDPRHELGDAPARRDKLAFYVIAICMVGEMHRLELRLELRSEATNDFRGQKPVADAGQCALLEFPCRDRPVGAGPGTMTLAAPAASTGREEGRLASSACDEPGQ